MNMRFIDYLLMSVILVLTVFVMTYLILKLRKPKGREVPSNSKRIYAFILDHLPIALIMFFVFIIRFYSSKAFGEEFKEYFNNQIEKGGGAFVQDMQFFFMKIVVIAYFTSGVGEILFSRGLGKKWMDLKVVSKNQSILARVLRWVLKPLALILFPVSIVLSFTTSRRQQLHERLSGTWLEEFPT
jgi:uncharacterized RDD family membrane protein YckC